MGILDVPALTQPKADTMYPRKGTLVFNVRDYGATGTWTSGTSGTVDTAAINAALAAAAAATSAATAVRVLVPWTTGNGYVIDNTITVPSGVELDMRSPFVYTGASGQPALVIGGSAYTRMRTYRIRLLRYAVTDWTSEADAGLVVHNHNNSSFYLDQIDQFTVGATFIGDTSKGFAYNEVHFGTLLDNKIAVDLTNDTGGWCNENEFFGGRFSVGSTVHTDLDRVGIRITSRATTPYYNNSNIFHKPSFELKGQGITGVSICMLATYAFQCRCEFARHESNSPTVLVQQNGSANNSIDFGYTDEGVDAPTYRDEGSTSSALVSRAYNSMVEQAQRTIYKADNLHKQACYYDGATSVNVPGLTVGTSSTALTDARAASSLVLNDNYLEIPVTRYAGFYMSTRVLKRFTVFRETEVGYGGRILIRCYDSNGNNLSTALTVRTSYTAGSPTWATAYGGGYKTTADRDTPLHIGVSDATDYVFIAITGGTSSARVRALSVATTDNTNPAVWLAYPDNNLNYGTTYPTAGTWTVGRQVINAVPASGQPSSWICTASGTPGTWLAAGATGAITPPTDVQVFTASGTWTMPANAISIEAVVVGCGGGGGSGRRGAAGTVRCGGGGGAGGAISRLELPASAVTPTVSVGVGTAGAGGAAVTADDTSGNAGGAGTTTTFGTYVRAGAGAGGVGGTAALGSGGALNTTGMFPSGAGGTASTTGAVGTAGSSPNAGAAGGGSGGGITTADVVSAGGNGGNTGTSSLSAATGGTASGGAGGAGTSTAANSGLAGTAGGGGGSNITGAGGNGGNGGNYGSGGGGGGASLNGSSSGAGGNGGAAICIVITHF